VTATAQARTGITLLRVAAASVFVIHGAARAGLGIVDDFGGYLSSSGFPAGTAVAWAITLVEILGGLLLALGLFVRPLVLWFAVQIAAGVVMIHGRVGWFVVGAGRNGAEYSALILVCLLAVVLTDSLAYKVRP
jgi:putative oxidoreductase